MRTVSLAGSVFEIEPDEALNEKERTALLELDRTLDGGSLPEALPQPVRLSLVSSPLWSTSVPDPGPAAVSPCGGGIAVDHRDFQAFIDVQARTARLFRRVTSAHPLEITLRVALCCTLPFDGGLPLHAAGVQMDGHGLVFFGPSGAGKSTISELSPFPVLSDELVVLRRDHDGAWRRGKRGWRHDEGRLVVTSSGFWGAYRQPHAPQGTSPLSALIELRKGPGFALERLSGREALVRLMGVVTIPAAPFLWSRAMAVLGEALRETTVRRMTWTPARPPWEELAEALALDIRREGVGAADPIPAG